MAPEHVIINILEHANNIEHFPFLLLLLNCHQVNWTRKFLADNVKFITFYGAVCHVEWASVWQYLRFISLFVCLTWNSIRKRRISVRLWTCLFVFSLSCVFLRPLRYSLTRDEVVNWYTFIIIIIFWRRMGRKICFVDSLDVTSIYQSKKIFKLN